MTDQTVNYGIRGHPRIQPRTEPAWDWQL